MREQLARMLGSSPRCQIAERSRGREPLHARPYGDRDHVLLKALVVADSRIAPDREQVNETILHHDLQADIWIGREERRDDRRQHDARDARGHIESEGSGWTVAE